mgnify:CR=1 FL=1
MNIRVIIPCYNEGEVVLKTYEKLTEILKQDSINKQYEYDLLFIDDGSKDSTIDHLQNLALADLHVKYNYLVDIYVKRQIWWKAIST